MMQWILVIGIAAICCVLLFAIEELRNLNNKIEYWGKHLSGTVDEIRAGLGEIQADTASLHHDLADISQRAQKHFPTDEEYEGTHNQP